MNPKNFPLDCQINLPQILQQNLYFWVAVMRKVSDNKHMDEQRVKQEIIDDYKKKGDEIIDKMLKILLRAQRKIDDLEYSKALKSFEEK